LGQPVPRAVKGPIAHRPAEKERHGDQDEGDGDEGEEGQVGQVSVTGY
jgi:hypothetical protein